MDAPLIGVLLLGAFILWLVAKIKTKKATHNAALAAAVDDYDWKRLSYKLESLERDLKTFAYNPSNPIRWENHPLEWGVPDGSLSLTKASSILSDKALAAPHGLDLLDIQLPPMPTLPPAPPRNAPDSYKYLGDRFSKLEKRLADKQIEITNAYNEQLQKYRHLHEAHKNNDPEAVKTLLSLTLTGHPLPPVLRRDYQIELDLDNKIALCTIEVPDLKTIPIVKKHATSGNWRAVSNTEQKKVFEQIVCSLCIRAAYLIAQSDKDNKLEIIAVNATQKWFDAATGQQREGIIASLQAAKSELERLSLNNVDPKACFRHLSGIVTPSFESISPIRPIFIMNTSDHRIVENKDVDALSQPEANLAAMPWEDFEHLVRQLFEWEFGRNGVEVKVTRASRDRGVDAIMFDPDPLRGGKYVLQAKRYTRLVDVAAVRDLYGTIMNEGANRGILVTTSSYGPDSYEFAKDKPISLVDGQNLIAMLRKHGKKYRVDLAEARRLEAENQNKDGQ